MNRNPDFYLTAAGEYRPLAAPRACWVKDRLRDVQGEEFLVVEMRPAFTPPDTRGVEISSVVLSARHQGDSLARITSWPVYVYVSRITANGRSVTEPFNKSQLQVIAWARLYPSVEGATHDAERHTAAVRTTRSPETVQAHRIRFVGEQEGAPERLLKEELVRLFSPDERIWKAYLARVDIGPDVPISITLCLRTVAGPDRTIVAKVGEVFARLFRTTESLDILFIDDEQEHDLARVCKPFYVRTVLRGV